MKEVINEPDFSERIYHMEMVREVFQAKRVAFTICRLKAMWNLSGTRHCLWC